ncbi:hypothetical protein CEXT_263711 [Caerostris extrusa]|uniref:Uncharacterized protein n=1 Tax=Caerostris extrusa TaxID=172846 RepID=A0AAV4Q5K1_CAEEX|nr:hypothetical protein CEXT_263711 [Caerostris extrusa]
MIATHPFSCNIPEIISKQRRDGEKQKARVTSPRTDSATDTPKENPPRKKHPLHERERAPPGYDCYPSICMQYSEIISKQRRDGGEQKARGNISCTEERQHPKEKKNPPRILSLEVERRAVSPAISLWQKKKKHGRALIPRTNTYQMRFIVVSRQGLCF